MSIDDFEKRVEEIRKQEGELYQQTYELYLRAKTTAIPALYCHWLNTIQENQRNTIENWSTLLFRIRKDFTEPDFKS